MYRHIDTHDHNYSKIFDRDVETDAGLGYTIGKCSQIHENNLYLNHINLDPPYFPGSNYPHIFKYDVRNNHLPHEEIQYLRTSGYDQRMKQFGAAFAVIHDLTVDSMVEFFVMSVTNDDVGLYVFDKDMNKLYGCIEHAGLSSDSDNKHNYFSMSTEKGDHQRFIIMTEDMIRNNSYVENCKLDHYSDILGVTNGEKFAYTLEGINADYPQSVYTNMFLLNMYDVKRGSKVGRIDLAMVAAVNRKTGQLNFELAVGYNGVNFGSHVEYNTFSPASVFAPHLYHDKPVIVKIKAITSCNALMPCSMFIVGENDVVAVDEPDYIDVHIHSIDHIEDHVIAVSYLIDSHMQYDFDGLHYQVDIVDMHGEKASVKTLDIDRVWHDYKCDGDIWYDAAVVFSMAHDHLEVTDTHIVVPVMMYRKIDHADIGLLYSLNNVKSVLALFNKKTFDYVSYIDIGEDVVVSNITSDCSQIAVSTVVIDNNKINDGHDIDRYADLHAIMEGAVDMSAEHIMVFKSNDMAHSCSGHLRPICNRGTERYWEPGTGNDDTVVIPPEIVYNTELIVQNEIDTGELVHYRFVTSDGHDYITANGNHYVNITHRPELSYELEPYITSDNKHFILEKI